MATVYIDDRFRCHPSDSGGMTPVETDFFSGKCDAFVEGYYLIPGDMIAPWKPYAQLEAAQRQYESDVEDVVQAYREGVNSIE